MRVGIIGAMSEEVELLKEEMKDCEVQTVAGMSFFAGTLGGTPAVVVQSGIGKVNAGMCVQILVDRYQVTHVINTGVAGSLDPRLDIGDLVVSVDCLQHDFDVTPLGYKPAEIPGVGTISFPADAHMRTATLEAAAEVAPEIAAIEGRIVSGDQFVTGGDLKDRLIADFNGTCCEMEGASVAQAAYLNGIPFVVVRAISDKPGSEGQTVEYATFEREAAHHCAKIVLRMVMKQGTDETGDVALFH